VIGRKVNPLRVVTHGQRHKARVCQRQQRIPRTCQSMVSTLQVDRLARITGLTSAPKSNAPSATKTAFPLCFVWRIGFGRGPDWTVLGAVPMETRAVHQLSNTKQSKPTHKYIHAHMHKIGILIQTRPAQQRSCSPGQVLHLWRAHSPPNPSLKHKLIQKLRRRSHPEVWLHDTELNNPRASQWEMWCYPARYWDVIPTHSPSDKLLRTPPT